ncbi:hypothetical protein NHH03_11755 [Stieleria sp. TO1_6]|uniref:hypothetical protein n=1 Tax=Stieleria tagensis TaxID=2956795 RepID=UPI00209AF2DF|nr:hypothetical protein [Stieleria tagensis]MCO8122413.1 hypothetical protein [Stieleria tagensis]
MNIQSTIIKNPNLKEAIAEGTLEEPSIILRTPDGNRDLLLMRKGYSDPNLKPLLFPIKSLVAKAITQMAPDKSALVEGVSVIIDLTVKMAGVIEKSQIASLTPIDATDQFSQMVRSADIDCDDPAARQKQMHAIFGTGSKPVGVISFLASFGSDDQTVASTSPVEIIAGEIPILGDLFQIFSGLVGWLDAQTPPSRLAACSLDPNLMAELRQRLSQPANETAT